MKILLLCLFLVSCASRTNQDRKHDCLLDLVKEGVNAKEASAACVSTFTNKMSPLEMRR